MRRLSALMALLGLALLLAAFVPWPTGAAQPAPAELDPGTADLAGEGAALFRAKGCVMCHLHDAVEGSGGTMVGPNLSHYEADPTFLRSWLADPSSVRPATLMPNLGLSDAEIEALIAFLAED